MKRFFALVLCLLLFTSNAFAAGTRIDLNSVYTELTVPEGYSAITKGTVTENQALLREIDQTAEEMSSYLSKNYLELYALSPDRKNELTLAVYKIDTFDVFDLAEATEDEMKSIEENIKNTSLYTCEEYEIVNTDNSRFIRTVRIEKDSDRRAVTYTTVKNGANYALTLLKSEKGKLTQEDLEAIDFVFKSFTFTEILKNPKKNNWIVILLLILLAIVSLAIIVVVVKRVGNWNNRTGILSDKAERAKKTLRKKH